MEQREEAEARGVQEVVERLAEKYPSVSRAEIEQIVHAEHESFAGRPIRDFVPVLVEKAAKKRVKALHKAA